MGDGGTGDAGLRVLVVDDDHDTADSLAIFLRHAGLEVQVAYDAEPGLALARTGLPAVVVLDIGLPSGTGYDLGRRIRRLPGLEHVTLVAVSGYGDDTARARSVEAGFDHHLVKPVEAERLLALLTAQRRGPLRAGGSPAGRVRTGTKT